MYDISVAVGSQPPVIQAKARRLGCKARVSTECAPTRCCRLTRAIEVKDTERTSIRVSNALEQVAALELLQVRASYTAAVC